MTSTSGWDPGVPPTAENGSPTIPEWMNRGGIGQLQILSLFALEEGKKLCPFVVGKSMKDLVGEIENTRTESNGMKYVLRVRDTIQVKKLLGMNTLYDGTAVTVIPHPTLNKRRCVISCRETIDKTESELLEGLANEGIIGVKRITRSQDGKRVNTPTIILTIAGTAIPEKVKVGPLRINTRMYIPDPLICFKCYSYGHSKLKCKNGAACNNCSKLHDLEMECEVDPYCKNCQGQHGPASRTCPIYVMEKEIIRLRFTKGISRDEALKQIEAGGGSYAAVSKVQHRLVTPKEHNSLSGLLLEKDVTIKQLTETINKLTARIEELEKKSYDKKEKKRLKKKPVSKEVESNSEMDTDSSVKPSTTDVVVAPVVVTSSQVSAGPSKPINTPTVTKHKRHYTSEIHPPLTKKSSADLNHPPNHVESDLPSSMKINNLYQIVNKMHYTKDSSHSDLPHT